MRRVEFGELTLLSTLIKEIARDDDLIATLKGLENKKPDSFPDEHYSLYDQLSIRFGIIFFDSQVMFPTGI